MSATARARRAKRGQGRVKNKAYTSQLTNRRHHATSATLPFWAIVGCSLLFSPVLSWRVLFSRQARECIVSYRAARPASLSTLALAFYMHVHQAQNALGMADQDDWQYMPGLPGVPLRYRVVFAFPASSEPGAQKSCL